jgi:hypothetical protein
VNRQPLGCRVVIFDNAGLRHNIHTSHQRKDAGFVII